MAAKPLLSIQKAIQAFAACTDVTTGIRVTQSSNLTPVRCGWIQFDLQKSELGWRTLEFLAWICGDMQRAGEQLNFYPVAPPPYLNEPGECLSFVLEVWSEKGDGPARYAKVAEFINWCKKEHWNECKKNAK